MKCFISRRVFGVSSTALVVLIIQACLSKRMGDVRAKHNGAKIRSEQHLRYNWSWGNLVKLIQKMVQASLWAFDQIPSQINLDDYIYKTPYGQVLKGYFRSCLNIKFKFCSFNMSITALVFGLSILSWAGHGFFYVYDHLSKK